VGKFTPYIQLASCEIIRDRRSLEKMNLENRKFFKVKNANNSFLCALCSAPRQMRYKRNLSFKNYLQLTTLAVGLMYFLYPVFGLKTIYLMFIIWVVAELANKMLYRHELPCPYCGFDATWYKRDVKMARKKVEDFWATKNSKQIHDVEANDEAVINNSSLKADSQQEVPAEQ
jgi:hypothetical protein